MRMHSLESLGWIYRTALLLCRRRLCQQQSQAAHCQPVAGRAPRMLLPLRRGSGGGAVWSATSSRLAMFRPPRPPLPRAAGSSRSRSSSSSTAWPPVAAASLCRAAAVAAPKLWAPRVALAGLSAGAASLACSTTRPSNPARAEAGPSPAALPEPLAFADPAGKAAAAAAVLPKPPQSAAAFFLEMLLPDLVLLFGAALASMGAAWSNVQISKLLGALSDSIVKLGARTSSGGAVDKAALSAAVAALSAPALALLKAYAVQGALSALYISVMSFIGERLAQRLRQRMYSALLCQDIGFFDEHRAAELTNRLTSDVQDFKSAFKSCCSTGLKASTQLLGSALALYQISPSLTILMMSVVGSMVSYLVHQMHLLT